MNLRERTRTFVHMKHAMSNQTGLTVPAAAARAGVDQTAIREAIHRGEIPARQTLVVQSADVDRWAATAGAGGSK